MKVKMIIVVIDSGSGSCDNESEDGGLIVIDSGNGIMKVRMGLAVMRVWEKLEFLF